MTRHKKRLTLAAMVLTAALLLTGCGLPGLFKPSVVSLSGKALKKMQDVQSARVTTDVDSEIKVRQDTLGLEMQADMDAAIEMDMTREPQRIRGNGELKVSVLGQDQTVPGTWYAQTDENGNMTTYMKVLDSGWVKHTGKTGEKTGIEDADGQGSGGQKPADSSAGRLIAPLMQTAGIFKALSDGSIVASLQEETVTVNDQEAYLIDCTITGPLMKELLMRQNLFTEDSAENLEKIKWDEVDFPAKIYLYKESGLPARITADCTVIGSQLLGDKLADSLGDLPVGEIRAEFTRLQVDMTIDHYNEVEEIVIPQEALDGRESETVLPEMEDFVDL